MQLYFELILNGGGGGGAYIQMGLYPEKYIRWQMDGLKPGGGGGGLKTGEL